jgi:hypothetical protein
MHLRDGSDEMLDAEGVELADLEAVRRTVLTNARDMMAGDIKDGIMDFRYQIDAEDETGAVVYSLPFKHAVNIIPEG